MEITSYESPSTLCSQCNHQFQHTIYDPNPVNTALRSNYSPELLESKLIVETMSTIDNHLARYTSEAARVRAMLEALLTRREELIRFKACCSSVLAPIRKLPPEILQAIFLACLDHKPNVIPITGQICQHWRKITISTPELWSNISVGRTRFMAHEKYQDLAALFLERSSNLPLSISLRQPVSDALISTLVEHTQRWRKLNLISTKYTFYLSIALSTLVFPLLETLEIGEEITPVAGIPVKPIPLPVGHVPRLRRVILKDKMAHWELPWSQITDIQYDTAVAPDGLLLLQKCPNLKYCAMEQLRFAGSFDSTESSAIPLRHLESLRLGINYSSNTVVRNPQTVTRSFFQRLVVPQLKSLQLIGQWSPEDFTDFLSRNELNQQLTHLSLGTGYMKDDNIIQILEALPLVQNLVLDADIGTTRQLQNRVITDKLLRRFILYPDSDCVLPALEHLTLRTSLNFDEGILLDIITSRWQGWATELYGIAVTRIASITFDFCGRRETLEQDTIQDLRDFRKDGLLITLRQGNEQIKL
ncbi:F-box domain-containing protein [Mycena indigotica]|uniref:F-box domain-containing protein n=1 Tax=Mycena indigotica TaxID=2126181 RepID=A0A8H6SB42_9AGAR|nr:F-box domain-containing protein [Mycena indigotica]KAF7294610.1 F-box domain-containing protein [Mycena indigotica]